jgi:hypothetical protein
MRRRIRLQRSRAANPVDLRMRSLAPRLNAIVSDLWAVLQALPGIEIGRRREGPLALLNEARKRGLQAVHRDPRARLRLQRTIRWVERLVLPGRGNCYRRALLEMALDSGAAREPLMLGLMSTGTPGSGHAWLASERVDADATYDCVLSV